MAIGLKDAHALTAAGRFVESPRALHLPRDACQPEQPSARQPSRKASQSGAKTASKIEHTRRLDGVHPQPREHLRVDLFQHRLPAQRIGAGAVVGLHAP